MSSRYPLFDRSRLTLRPLSERVHDLTLDTLQSLRPEASVDKNVHETAVALHQARSTGAQRILMMGAHLIRSGVQRYLIDLMENGFITCLAGNGACAIHDFEFAMIGATTESVRRYIQTGQFGLWQETGHLNDIVADAARRKIGIGEALGEYITTNDLPHKKFSLFAHAYRLGIPFTVHVGIGMDIVHEHPNCDPASVGTASYTDFLIFARCVQGLESGVFMNLGSAVTGPEIFLKALAMARNCANREGSPVDSFSVLVSDLHELPQDTLSEPPRGAAHYYYRPWKTLLSRAVKERGVARYVQRDHRKLVPELWTALQNLQ